MPISQTLHSFLNCAKSVQRAHINPISSALVLLLVIRVLRDITVPRRARRQQLRVKNVRLASSPQQALVHVRGVKMASSMSKKARQSVTRVDLANSHTTQALLHVRGVDLANGGTKLTRVLGTTMAGLACSVQRAHIRMNLPHSI